MQAIEARKPSFKRREEMRKREIERTNEETGKNVNREEVKLIK
jgi:hypothetical protein